MTLLYFDGFDQYVDIPAPTAALPVSYVRGINNQVAVPADPTVTLINDNSGFCKLYGEDRVWRVPFVNGTVGTVGSFTYSHDRLSPVYTRSQSTTALMINSGKTLQEHQKLVFGFKIKHADYQYRYYNSNVYNLPLAVFSPNALFTSQTTTWAVVVGYLNQVSIRPLTATFQYTFNGNSNNNDWPAGTFIDGDSPLLGTCNFVYGDSGGNSSTKGTPPIEQLAANTVEVEVTATGKVSVWINNQFIGSCTFANLTYVSGIQYVKTNFIPSYTNSVAGPLTLYGFSGVTDMYLLNGLGTRNNKRLGKVKVLSRRPVIDSAVQFTRPDTANSNAEVAGSVPPVFSNSLTGVRVGDTDLYASNAFNFTNEAILAASIITTGYKTDPSGNDIAPVLSVGGTQYVGNTNIVPVSATQMKTEQAIYELNPKTGLPFTKGDLDASTFGVTVVPPVVGP